MNMATDKHSMRNRRSCSPRLHATVTI